MSEKRRVSDDELDRVIDAAARGLLSRPAPRDLARCVLLEIRRPRRRTSVWLPLAAAALACLGLAWWLALPARPGAPSARLRPPARAPRPQVVEAPATPPAPTLPAPRLASRRPPRPLPPGWGEEEPPGAPPRLQVDPLRPEPLSVPPIRLTALRIEPLCVEPLAAP